MSWQKTLEPTTSTLPGPSIDVVLEGRDRLIDGFPVARVLPSSARRLVGPFIFFDHFGPASLAPGQAFDVRPHPHINLATVTYLFDGEITHRDSLGFHQVIRPGAINWMTAGRGIVHSERTPSELRPTGSRLHGIQLWIALPRAHEEEPPSFHHHTPEDLPAFEIDGVKMTLLAGSAYGKRSPVNTFSSMFYVEARLRAGQRLTMPAEHAERGAYVVEGAVSCEGQREPAKRLLVFKGGADAVLTADSDAHLMLVGGEPMDGPRHVYWNFASSSTERIEQAKRDWREGRFPKVPGDEVEFIPLPDEV